MNPIEYLASDEFKTKIGAASSPHALRRYLTRCDAVNDARKALVEGRVTEQTIRAFSDQLMDAFERGVQFPHELALAAMAVVLENRRNKFAEDFLIDLARLVKFEEMDIAPRVAGLSLNEWHKAPKVLTRVVPSANRLHDRPQKLRTSPPRLVRISRS